MSKFKLFLILLFLIPSVITYAQNIQVSGKIIQDRSTTTLPGVGIIIMNANDTAQKLITVTDANGSFKFNGLAANTSYLLKTAYVGFSPIIKNFRTEKENLFLGSIVIAEQTTVLDEITIQGQKTPVVQKGDTTEMSSSAYKVNVDATAQDLVQKMPGMTIENGTVKAHGEEVKRVLVDGKNYYGDDATAALQNLPADIVDKVQILNKMSDQAEFTGIDDGNSSKVINVITRADRRKGENGNLTAGTDFVDKYSVNGRLNLLRDTKKITVNINANNVNNQGFSFMDILGASGGDGRGRMGGRGGNMMGRSSGLNKPISAGINYINEVNKKLTISGSYFFNKQDNYTTTTSSSQNTALFSDTIFRPIFTEKSSVSSSKNYNHRFDMKLEYNIDSANSIIWSPRLNSQNYKSSSSSNANLHNILPDVIQHLDNTNANKSWGYNYSNDLTFRHKFSKTGRTFTLGTTISGNLNEGDGTNYSLTQIINRADSILDQHSESNTKGTTYSGNAAYTEPVGKFSIVQLGYNLSFSDNSTDKKVFDNNTNILNQKYSNVFESNYNRQRLGLTYIINTGEKISANIGVDYQMAALKAERTYPNSAKVNSDFNDLLPNAMVNIKFNKKSNIRAFYRTSTNAPSVTDLQDVITKSGTYNFSQGNPNLLPEYSHNANIHYRFSNSENFSNFTLGLMGNFTKNAISNAIVYPSQDTTIYSGSSFDIVTRAGSLTKPMNFNKAWNTMIFANYGFLFTPIKCNLNFSGRLIYSNSPGSVNNILNSTNSYSIVGGLTVASNISKNADFTVSYMATRSISDVKYFGDITAFKSKLGNFNNNTWNQTISLTTTFTMFERLVLKNIVSGTILTGFGTGYNQNYWLWNPSLGLKIFKNKLGQVSVSVYDALKKNQSISHTVSALSISDSRTNILQRFVLFSFTYTIRNYGPSNQDKRGDYGPPGGFGGGPGPGGPGGPGGPEGGRPPMGGGPGPF